MSEKFVAAQPPVGSTITTTLVYKKRFAVLGIVCGFVLFFGTPFMVFVLFDELLRFEHRWKRILDALPPWLVPAMLLVGMVAGLLTILLSALFCIVIPSTITRGPAPRDAERPAA